MNIILSRIAFTAGFAILLIGGGLWGNWDWSLAYWLGTNITTSPGVVMLIVGLLLIAASHIFFERMEKYTYGNLLGMVTSFGALVYIGWSTGWISFASTPTLWAIGIAFFAIIFGWLQSARHAYYMWRRVRSMDRSDDAHGNGADDHGEHH